MSMISINYEDELRKAFAAGQQSMLPLLMKRSGWKGMEGWKVPRSYEEWIESRADEPQIARG